VTTPALESVELFELLWRRSDERKPCQFVSLPQTIVFKNDTITHWFFTSIKDGLLKKKSSMNVTRENCFQAFLKHHNETDIIAMFISPGVSGGGDQDGLVHS